MIVQYLGIGFVGIIVLCTIYTIFTCVFNDIEYPNKQNKKLLDNMKKLKK
jgi:hypothetical protein|tara:strand:+ start:357 stop:506 length:150 start_codon:yes stop_codon:yes gene_type:complete